jgi:predicted GNAT family acetyltransferase
MSETGDLQVVNNEAEGRFEVRLGDQVAYTEYRLLKTGILFPHTEVPPAFEGQGVGGKLVRAGMAFARERGELVIPVCPFVAAFITRHPEYHDLVHPDYRAALHI